MIAWKKHEPGVLLAGSPESSGVAQDIAAHLSRRGNADVEVSETLEDWITGTRKPPGKGTLVTLVSNEMLERVGGASVIEQCVSKLRSQDHCVLPVRIGKIEARSGLVEIDIDEFGAEGVADLIMRRVQVDGEDEHPTIDLADWPRLDCAEVDEVLDYYGAWSPGQLKDNLRLNVVMPHDLRELRRRLDELQSRPCGNLEGIRLATQHMTEVDKELCVELQQGVGLLISSATTYAQNPRRMRETIAMFLLTRVAQDAVFLSMCDLDYERTPDLVVILRKLRCALGTRQDAFIATMAALGQVEEFWIDAELREAKQSNVVGGRRYPAVHIPGSVFLESVLERQLEIPVTDELFALTSPQLIGEMRDVANCEYYLAFPDRFILDPRGKQPIDGATAKVLMNGQDIRHLETQCLSAAIERLSDREKLSSEERQRLHARAEMSIKVL